MERLRITAKDNQFVKDAAGLLESAKPVSYTHLDVYKRQTR